MKNNEELLEVMMEIMDLILNSKTNIEKIKLKFEIKPLKTNWGVVKITWSDSGNVDGRNGILIFKFFHNFE